MIQFSEKALQVYDEPKLRKLCAHEIYHFYQDVTGRYPMNRRLREFEAERFAIQRSMGYTFNPVLNRPTPLYDIAVVTGHNPHYAGHVLINHSSTYSLDSHTDCCCI